jgi:hypothetical protein
MSALLVALGGRLNSTALLSDVDRLKTMGFDVHLVSWAPPSPELAASLDELVVLARASDTPTLRRGAPSERAVQEVLEHAEDSLSAGDMPGSERIEESVGTADDNDDEAEEGPAGGAAGEAGAPVAAPPRVKAAGARRIGEVAGRVLRNPRPYVTRMYVLIKRRTRPYSRRLRRARQVFRRGLRRRIRALRANLHQPKATAAFFHNDRVHDLATAADVVVAVDSSSVLAVWTLARRRNDVLAVIGVDAAVARWNGWADTTA